jgi:uncharacterized membrane protein YciS (DUF1049 family)
MSEIAFAVAGGFVLGSVVTAIVLVYVHVRINAANFAEQLAQIREQAGIK